MNVKAEPTRRTLTSLTHRVNNGVQATELELASFDSGVVTFKNERLRQRRRHLLFSPQVPPAEAASDARDRTFHHLSVIFGSLGCRSAEVLKFAFCAQSAKRTRD